MSGDLRGEHAVPSNDGSNQNGPWGSTTRGSKAMPLFGRFTASCSQFANRHGVYLGRRSTKIHVALYRRSGGRIGGHLPGWPGHR